MKSNAIYTDVSTEEALRLQFRTGEVLELTFADLGEDILFRAAKHGIKQKVIDSMAMSRDPTTGKSATPGEKIAAAREVVAQLLVGKWSVGRGAGSSSLEVLAIMASFPKFQALGRAATKEWFKSQSLSRQAGILGLPAVQVAMAKLLAEQAKGIDGDAIALEMMG
jgi:hypothetical protein